MGTLGELERSIMDALWDAPEPLSSGDVRDLLDSGGSGKESAVTTILTVLSRLEKKGFVVRDRSIRPHRYRAAATREDYTAELMHTVLGDAPNREAVLTRFIGQVSAPEAEMLRRALSGV